MFALWAPRARFAPVSHYTAHDDRHPSPPAPCAVRDPRRDRELAKVFRHLSARNQASVSRRGKRDSTGAGVAWISWGSCGKEDAPQGNTLVMNILEFVARDNRPVPHLRIPDIDGAQHMILETLPLGIEFHMLTNESL